MRCERFQDKMVASLYGELDTEAEKELRTHLTDCAECAAEFEALRVTLVTMDKRERTDPGGEYWDGYWDRLSERMQEERVAPAAPQSSWWSRSVGSPGRWAYRVAAAAAILTVGVFAGRTFLAPGVPVEMSADTPVAQAPVEPVSDDATTDAQIPEQVAGNTGAEETTPDVTADGGRSTPPAETTTPPSTTSEPMTVMPASSQRAMRYIEKSQLLLVALVNNDPSAPDGYAADMGLQQRRSRALVDEAEQLKEDLDDPRQRRLRELVTELEKILLQIANLESEDDMDAVEFIRSRVNEHDVLFKINLEQMRHGTDVDGSASGTARGSNSQRSI